MKKRIFLAFLVVIIFALAFSSCRNGIDTSTETDTETATDTSIETGTSTQTDTTTDTESDTDTGTDTNTEAEVESDTESETETETQIADVLLEINDKKSRVGQIAFDITFNKIEGEFSLFFADKEKNVLPYYSSIAKIKGKIGKTEGFREIILPKNCKYIMISGESNWYLEIPNEYCIEDSFRFSALSDIHYNKGDYFNSALDFLDTQDIDFVGVAGDLTNNGELEYLKKYNNAIKDREYKVYTTNGNHDVGAILSGAWEENINTKIYADGEVLDVSRSGFDFVYQSQKGGGVFVFLAQMRWNYPDEIDSTEYTIIDQSQLIWLEEMFEKYKDETVYLFFHTFLSDPDGKAENSVGNLKTSAGYEYDLPFSYGSADEEELRLLLKKYKNVIFFSGHSHWMFQLEELNENLNFSNFGGEYGYMVHIPSVCDPRYIEDDQAQRTSMVGKSSQGWIIDETDEVIIFTPVDFIEGIYFTEYMKIIYKG